MPVGLVRAYIKMLPRLHAEDMLDHGTAVALGTGSLKDAKAVTRNLMSAARGEGRPRRSTPSPAALALMGIKVERVKTNG